MADAESIAVASPLSVVAAWRWLALWIVAAASIDALLPARTAVDVPLSLTENTGEWTLSRQMVVSRPQGQLRFTAEGAGPHAATRRLDVAEGTEFIELKACVATALAPGQAAIMLASVSGQGLDFNRNYLLGALSGAQAGECVREALPRRRGDGSVFLQVQLRGTPPEMLVLSSLSLTPLRENPPWRWTRRVMLSAGLLLLALRFKDYFRARPMPLALGGLAVVVGIVFGCVVSVPLKADIYALFTGGRSMPMPQAAESLLFHPFPVGGFGIFTSMHALLFGAAALFLGLLRRWSAWTDLLLLGAATETLQRFVPGRGPGVSDLLVDWSGVLLGALLVLLLGRSQRVRLLLKQQRVDENTPGL